MSLCCFSSSIAKFVLDTPYLLPDLLFKLLRESHSLVSQQKGALGEQGKVEDGEPVNTS